MSLPSSDSRFPDGAGHLGGPPAGQAMTGFRRKPSRSHSFVSSAMARPTAIMSATAASILRSGRCLAG